MPRRDGDNTSAGHDEPPGSDQKRATSRISPASHGGRKIVARCSGGDPLWQGVAQGRVRHERVAPTCVSPYARAKKLPRAAECLVYSLTPSGVLAENHPKNRGFVGILRGQKCLRRGQKCLKRPFSRRSPVGEWSRGARSMARVFGRGSRSQPALSP